MTFNSDMQKAWDYLISKGLTPEGTAGLMGNLYSESAGFFPNRVEFLCIKRLKEYYGKDYTDSSYTAEVDSGVIGRDRFLNPIPGKQYGYGLVQWTTPSRKAGLYDLCKKRGVSISDLQTQLDYLMQELTEKYPTILKILKSTGSIKEASDKVLKDFESPANWSQWSASREQYGQDIYNRYYSPSGSVDDVLSVAAAEIGYLEKASNKDLDSFTGNAGSNNYTKYWRDVYPAYQAQAWCACFVSWVLMKVYGQTEAKRLLKHWPYVYCPDLAAKTTNKVPKRGSIIIFFRNGVYAHTGFVESVNGNKITTIEGNTSGASGIVPNGGGVCRKTYDITTLSSNTKYFMPDYRDVKNPQSSSQNQTQTAAKQEEVKDLYIVKDKAGKVLNSFKKYVNAIHEADRHSGSHIYDQNGKVMYPSDEKPKTIVEACKIMSDRLDKGYEKWYYSNGATKSTWASALKGELYRTNCAKSVNWALVMIGVLDASDWFYGCTGGSIAWGSGTKEKLKRAGYEFINIGGKKTVSTAIKDGTLKPHDIVTYVHMTHTNVYEGNGRWYDFGHAYCRQSGEMAPFISWHGGTVHGSQPIGWIIRKGGSEDKPKKTYTSTKTTPQFVGKVNIKEAPVRVAAGAAYSKIAAWPMLAKGNLIDVCDTIKSKAGNTWYKIRIAGKYYGYVYSKYITRV